MDEKAIPEVSNPRTSSLPEEHCNICGSFTNHETTEPSLITLLYTSVLKIELGSHSVWRKFCTNCSAALKEIAEMEVQIRSLKIMLSEIQDRLLATVISQLVNTCVHLGTGTNNAIFENPGLQMVTKSAKLLGQMSTGYRVYKKWRLKFTSEFLSRTSTTESVKNNFPECTLSPAIVSVAQADGIRPDEAQFCIDHDYTAASSVNTISRSRIESSAVSDETDESALANYPCMKCNRSFSRKVSLVAHIEKRHKSNYNPKSTCPVCRAPCDTDEIMQNHIKENHSRTKCQKCDICLAFYVVQTKGSTEVQNHKCRKYSRLCACCGDTFNTKSDYIQHTKEVGENFQKRKRNPSKAKLKRNSVHFNANKICLKTSSKIRPCEEQRTRKYVCESCSKQFATRTELSIHSRIHSGEKPFICETCGQLFSSLASVHSHRKTHSGIRPHKCLSCGKSFRSAGHLSKHAIIHSGAKPFGCSVCQKSFNRRENLKTHQLTHAQVRPFPCEQCPLISFTRASLLKNHVIEHHSSTTSTELVPNASQLEHWQDASISKPPQVSSELETAVIASDRSAVFDVKDSVVSYVQEAVIVSEDGGQYIVFKEVPHP